MLNSIIHFSIKNKLIVSLFVVALVVWGVWSFNKLPIDAVPDITNNQVQIITVSPSLAAQEVERLITAPVEVSMANIPGIEESRSFSRFGLSVVTIVFSDETDIYWARQQVSEKLKAAIEQIPPGVGIPELAPVSTGLGEIYQYVIRTKKGYENKYSVTELRTIQDWIVRRQLLGTKGVADISSFGGFVKQYEIAVNPDRIRSMGVSITEIYEALQKNNQNTGGAYIDKSPNSWFIRTEGLIGTTEDIQNVVVKNLPNGSGIRIKNVADVRIGSAIRYGALTHNETGETVGGIVLMLKGENSSKVIEQVKDKIKQIEKTLPEGLVVEPFLDRTRLVDNAIGTVTKNLIEGALIVIFVLVLLLGNWRAGFVVASVIPLAMLFAISMMHLFGVSGNLMSLGAIDFGLIVDGAVIIVEATLHHLYLQNNGKNLTQDEMDDEVYHSAVKIRNSAAFGEIVIMIVYLPILALVGVEGKMFKPMAQTVAFAIAGAFILSLTYVPMISALVLQKKIQVKQTFSDKIMQFFTRLYKPVLAWALSKRIIVVSFSTFVFVISIWVYTGLGGEFLPTLDEGDFAVETRVMMGSSMQKTIDASLEASKILKQKFPEVRYVVAKIGSSEIPTDPMPIEACDLMVILKEKDEWTSATTREELAEKMQKALEDIPGVTFGFQQPIQMRFNELMTGARQDVAVKIYGDDLDELTVQANKLAAIVRKIDGAKDLYVEQVNGLPQIVVQYNRDKMALYGLSITDVNRIVQSAFAGVSAGLVYEGEKRFELVVRLDSLSRKRLDDLRNLYVITNNGVQIPLSQLADVRYKTGPNQIQRDDARRRITVAFNVRGRDVESVVQEIQAKAETQMKLPVGYYLTYGGQFKNLIEAKERLSYAVPVALLLILVLLYLTFHSMKQTLLIFTAIPFAAIGGIWALWLRDMPFSISAGVGFIALFGVAVLNGIVLIAEFNYWKKENLSLMEIVQKATEIRLRPVLMTALVASLGFLPMALSNGSGAEVQKPLATVVIGGLVSSTLLTLFVLPVLYTLFESGSKVKPIHTIVVPIILLLTLIGSNASQAQVLRSDEAVTKALESNLKIRQSKQEVHYFQSLKKTAIDIPKTNVSFQYGQFNSYYMDNNITVNQTIPSILTMAGKSTWYKTQELAAQLEFEKQKNEITYQVRLVYNDLVAWDQKMKWLIRQDSLLLGLQKMTETKMKYGESNVLDLMYIKTQRADISILVRQIKSDIVQSQLKLKNLCMLDFIPMIDTLSAFKMSWKNSDTSLLSTIPEIALAENQIKMSKAESKIEKGNYFPDIQIGYFNQSMYGTTDYRNMTNVSNETHRFQGLIVGLSLPIWFFTPSSKVKSIQLKTESMMIQNKFVRLNLQNKIAQLYEDYKRIDADVVQYEKEILPLIGQLNEYALKSFKAGESDRFVLIQSMSKAAEIQIKYIQSVQNYNQTIIELEYVLNQNKK